MTRPAWLRGAWGTMVFPLVVTLIIAALRWLLGDLLGLHHHLVFFYLAVAGCTVLVNWQAGLTATLAGGVVGYLLFLRPSLHPDVDDFAELGLFIVVASVAVLIVHWADRQRLAGQLRENAALAAEKSRAQLEALIQAASDGIIVVDPKGLVVLANCAQARIHGFASAEELIRAGPQLEAGLELLTADGALLPREQWPLRRLVNGESIIDLELCCRRVSDGNEKWLSFAGEPIRDGDGHTIAGIMVTRDITESRRVERQIRESREALNEAQAVSSTGSWRLNVERNRLQWSDETYRIFGIPIGTPLTYEAFLAHVHPDDRARVDKSWQEALSTGTYNIEHRIVVGGEVKWVNERAQLEFSRDGKLRSGFGTVQDISERKEIENALAAAKSEAEEASRQKDHFLAVLSHELRTPLMPVLTAVSMLRDSIVDGTVRETLGMLQRNIELEARLIDDLLDVTRIARGKMTIELRPCELGAVLRDVVEVCRPDLDARGLRFALECACDSPSWTMGDTARLQQVFWNLLRNAVKFTPHGGSVTIRCVRDGPTLVVEVKDTGIGIEPQALQRIFNAFEQESAATNVRFGGLGLGLAITKALVELHGGCIQAHSDGKGKGASFVVQLPVCAAPAETGRRPARQAKSARALSILLVEDHGDTARVLRRLLEARGHRVQTAGDVAGALEAVAKNGLDLLISDLGLPDGSGVEMMAKVRSLAPGLPAIALSGFGQEEDISNALQAGFREHLVKPISPDRLLECIERVALRPAVLRARPGELAS